MLKPGRIVALVFVFSAACALPLNAQQETKKQETKKESKLKISEARAARTERWAVSDSIGTIEKVDAEKKTITIKEEDGQKHMVTIGEDVTVKDFQGNRISDFDEKHLFAGAIVGWKPDRKGKITQLYVGIEPGLGGKLPGLPRKGQLKKLEANKEKSKDNDKNKEVKKE
jgi:hypothetical protein